MSNWAKQEIEEAFEKFKTAAKKGGQTGNWRDWANCFTEDADYIEHHYGRFKGREAIFNWITETMQPWPVNEMTLFPVTWQSIDEEKGWVIFEVMNRMNDIGDGQIHEEPNITILHYAGDGLFNYEEDVYNPENLNKMIGAWLKAKKEVEASQ